MCDEAVHDQVKDYYGKKVQKTTDLKLSACTVSTGTRMSKHAKEALASVHEEVCKKYYGCGLVIPEGLEGMKILDLGSGSGQDCFVLSKLVGPEGYVVGIDMTQEQLDVANQYIDYHTKLYDYKKPNVKFVKGYIERLVEAGLEENSFDIVISNCVINLSPDKRAVLSQSYKILKEGGELYFSDVYASQEVPDEARNHKDLWGECISGALYWKDFHELAGDVGFSQARIVSVSPISVDREDFRKILGDIQFVSVTYRLFKLPSDYPKTAGQAIYNGEITDHEDEFKFDHQLKFLTNEPVCIDSETHAILKYSRFKDEFLIRTQKCGTTDEGDSSPAVINPFELLKTLQSSGKTVANACCGGKKCC
ncbi:arsenite methyltransferase isoform X1 [Octopus sinensis]|uniref:Arsenite methyltransferase n=1 Tax=Octopus sinensis TaxID=2607531 RepID=A0A6P7U559_9MOLL|nr:arsenite methyltransferase isoform X1 [Octopus sinensis]